MLQNQDYKKMYKVYASQTYTDTFFLHIFTMAI